MCWRMEPVRGFLFRLWHTANLGSLDGDPACCCLLMTGLTWDAFFFLWQSGPMMELEIKISIPDDYKTSQRGSTKTRPTIGKKKASFAAGASEKAPGQI